MSPEPARTIPSEPDALRLGMVAGETSGDLLASLLLQGLKQRWPALRAVNLTGLKRRDFSAERIATIRNMHKALYRKSQTLELAKAEIEGMRGDDAGIDADIDTMLNFIASATRGLVR